MTPTEAVAHYGESLFGIDWPRHAARAFDVNVRTLQRIRIANELGGDQDSSIGVLFAMAERLDAVQAEVREILEQRR